MSHMYKHGESCKMRKQRNKFQTKEYDKTSEKYINDMERVNTPNEKFKLLYRCSLTSGEEGMKTMRNLMKETETQESAKEKLLTWRT